MAESELHKTIKLKAVDYLMAKGYWIVKKEVYTSYYGIVDAWGINPHNLNTMGIEVKVSRSDWKAAKYKDYRLAECAKPGGMKGWNSTNEIYYACPAGLINKDEVDENCGLLWYTENGRFKNIKKSKFVNVYLSEKMQTLIWSFVKWSL